MPAGNPEHWKKAGDGYFELKKFTGAVECYLKLIELNAENAEAWHCLGASFENLEKYAEAAKCFREERRIRGEQIKQKNNPGSGEKIPVPKTYSPVRIISIGLLLTFLSSVFIMILTYGLLGAIDWVATLLVGVLSAVIFLARIFWKQR
ncbi:MAG TPA: tetratricopeptide repeat protein [Methanoregulaceae archaeon]|nr:tetratricopeptide repeat protein [Methanoregulaceae archaeon]